MTKDYPLIYSDGGRDKEGYPNECFDCTVRALAIACDIPYREAHEAIKNEGRKDGKRFYSWNTYIQKININGIYGKKFVDMGIIGIKTTGQFIKKYKIGTYILRTKGHVFVVKNGKIYDNFKDGLKRKLFCVWEVVKL